MKLRPFLLLTTLLFAVVATSQVKEIKIQAAGLTCSMCSKSIHKALKALPIVKDVFADIKTSSFTVHLTDSNHLDFDVLQKAIVQAGFSVAKFTALVSFKNVEVENDTHINYAGKTLHFVNVKKQELNGDYYVTVIDKNYITAKEFKTNAKLTALKCYQTGKAQTCCSNAKIGDRVYHVMLNN